MRLKKGGVALFLELLGRNFGKLLLSTMLYITVSLPILAIYATIISIFFRDVMSEEAGSVGFAQMVS